MAYDYQPLDLTSVEGVIGDLLRATATEAACSEQEVYVVGGFPRDLILGRPNSDIDFVTIGSALPLAKRLSKRLNAGRTHTFQSFGTAQFRFKGLEVEFVGARRESYRRDSRKPIVEDGTLEDDLARRDFTINALAISLNPETLGQLVDLHGGLEDLNRTTLRTPLDPTRTFDDDPLRMMRAARFAAQLGFTIDDDTFEAMRNRASRLTIVSAERISTELNKIMLSPVPSMGLLPLANAGILNLILPELTALKVVETVEGKGHKDNFLHTLQVLDNLALQSENLWTRWAALLHDIGKAPTKRFIQGQGWTFHAHEFVGERMVRKIFNRLRLPQDERMVQVQKLVGLHMRPIALVDDQVTDSAVRRLLFDAGDQADELMQLCQADITSKNPKTVARHLANFQLVKAKMEDLESRDAIRNFQPPISGELIMKTLGIGPCRDIGDIKNAIKDAILDGQIPNSYPEAYALMLELARRKGYQPLLGDDSN